MVRCADLPERRVRLMVDDDGLRASCGPFADRGKVITPSMKPRSVCPSAPPPPVPLRGRGALHFLLRPRGLTAGRRSSAVSTTPGGCWCRVWGRSGACQRVWITRTTGHRWRAERGGVPPVRLDEDAPSHLCLSLLERQRIATLRARGLGARQVARRLERAPSTVSRELGRMRRPVIGALIDRTTVTSASWTCPTGTVPTSSSSPCSRLGRPSRPGAPEPDLGSRLSDGPPRPSRSPLQRRHLLRRPAGPWQRGKNETPAGRCAGTSQGPQYERLRRRLPQAGRGPPKQPVPQKPGLGVTTPDVTETPFPEHRERGCVRAMRRSGDDPSVASRRRLISDVRSRPGRC